MPRKQPAVPPTPARPRKKPHTFEIDEVHVQVIVRELDGKGETVDKHTPPVARFVSERAFRAWAAKPFNFVDERDVEVQP